MVANNQLFVPITKQEAATLGVPDNLMILMVRTVHLCEGGLYSTASLCHAIIKSRANVWRNDEYFMVEPHVADAIQIWFDSSSGTPHGYANLDLTTFINKTMYDT